MSKIDESIINAYNELLNKIPSIIKSNKLDKGVLSEQSGISRRTLFRKLKNKNFTPNEVVNLVKAINS